MADLVRWSGHGGISFFVNSSEIRGMKDFQISASAETENATSGGEKYVRKKNAGGYEISMTAELNAALGVNVREVSLLIAEAARCGDAGYFYCGETKLFPASFMMTEARVGSILITQTGEWKSCDVSMTLKQCGKYDGTTGYGSSGGSGRSSGATDGKKATASVKALTVAAVGGVKSTLDMAKQAIGATSAAKVASARAYQNLTSKQKPAGGGLPLIKENSKFEIVRN